MKTKHNLEPFSNITSEGGVEDTRLEAKDTKKSEAKDCPSEDRSSQDQGQECARPRLNDTDTSVLQKKKRFSKKIFRRSPKYKKNCL